MPLARHERAGQDFAAGTSHGGGAEQPGRLAPSLDHRTKLSAAVRTSNQTRTKKCVPPAPARTLAREHARRRDSLLILSLLRNHLADPESSPLPLRAFSSFFLLLFARPVRRGPSALQGAHRPLYPPPLFYFQLLCTSSSLFDSPLLSGSAVHHPYTSFFLALHRTAPLHLSFFPFEAAASRRAGASVRSLALACATPSLVPLSWKGGPAAAVVVVAAFPTPSTVISVCWPARRSCVRSDVVVGLVAVDAEVLPVSLRPLVSKEASSPVR